MRYGLVYLLETRCSISADLSAAECRAFVPRVFSMAFRDKLDVVNVKNEVGWHLLNQMYYERSRAGKKPAKAWVAVQAAIQTEEQLAATAEANDRVDTADTVVRDADGTTLIDKNDYQLDGTTTRHHDRIVLRANVEISERVNKMETDQLTALREAISPGLSRAKLRTSSSQATFRNS